MYTVYGLGWETSKEDAFGNIASDGKIILKLMLTDIGRECLDRVNPTKNRNQWRDRANTIINL
jgi:hypothetical protein